MNDLENIEKIQIPRCFTPTNFGELLSVDFITFLMQQLGEKGERLNKPSVVERPIQKQAVARNLYISSLGSGANKVDVALVM